MRILHTVQLYHPHRGGSEEVVKQISERLAARGHEVTVATAWDPQRRFDELNGVSVRSFQISGNEVLGIKGDRGAYEQFLVEETFDVVMNYAAQIWSTDLALPLLTKMEGKKVMVPCGYDFRNPAYDGYYQDLPSRLKSYDTLVYMSENYQDKIFGDRHGLGDRAVIIPNGAAAEEFENPSVGFRQWAGIETPYLTLNVSNHYELKGHRRIIEAFRQMNRKDTTLAIVGEVHGRAWAGCYPACRWSSTKDRRIRLFRNLERKSVVAAYNEADVFVLGSDIECAPLVIYEAMAAGIPFVSTDCGNVQDNSFAGIVVRDPTQLGPQMSLLLDQPELRNRFGEAGRTRWRQAHTWNRITDMYEDLYTRLIA